MNNRNILNYLKQTAFLRMLLLMPFYLSRFVFYSIKENSSWFSRYYPGYHGSTIPSQKYIKNNSARLFLSEVGHDDGIAMNAKNQLKLLEKFIKYYGDFNPVPVKSAQNLYYYQNDMFGFNDAFFLTCFLKEFKPKKVIEIGSGFSSGLMLDAAQNEGSDTEFIFIDPYSKNITEILKNKPDGKYVHVREEIQDVDLNLFSHLNENDILFVDSSHVIKIGSDLSTILFKILPALNKGVIIHFHDIWYPWEYPKEIITEGRAYNEIYAVRAFLQFNSSFEILFFNSYAEYAYKDLIESQMKNFFKSTGKSLWLRKC